VGLESSAGGRGGRRGFGRAAATLALLLAAFIVVAAGCGDSGHGAETDPEKGSDAAILNDALVRELTLLDAYTQGQTLLRGREREVGRRLRAQQGEYVDALNKAIRGLGGDTEAEAEALPSKELESEAALLALATKLEDAAVEFYVDEAAHLYTSAPRTLDAWLAAGHGGHLAMLPAGTG
jgi:Ferritin-like domain